MNFENLNMGNNVSDQFKKFCSYLVSNHASDVINAYATPLSPSPLPKCNHNSLSFVTRPLQLRHCSASVRRGLEEAAVQDSLRRLRRAAKRSRLVGARVK
jgi:hypothetical protein